MGLDTVASRSPDEVELTAEDREAFRQAAIELCGGFWSGVGDPSSFRGKVYVAVVDRVAGASLTDEWIPPEGVRGIAAAFERCDPARVVEQSADDASPVTEFEIMELRRFFNLCARARVGSDRLGMTNRPSARRAA
jgi:hypothetical protein